MVHRLIALALCGLCTALTFALPPAPPAPETYNVILRYRIIAFRNERLRQYFEMTRFLKSAGFVRDPDEIVADDEPDNPKATRMRGTLPAKQVDRVLRQRHIRALVLYPKDTKLPTKGTRVRADVRLASGFVPEIQRQLAQQTVGVLTRDAGFVEAVGYDRLGNSRLVGSVPVENLDKLLEDIRELPSAADEGQPLRNVSSIRAVYVRPDWPVPAGRPKAPEVPEQQKKFAPELRRLLQGGDAGKRARLEVILGWRPAVNDEEWRKYVQVPGVTIEGRVGSLVTVAGLPKDIAPRLAEVNEIVVVRVPRVGRTGFPGTPSTAPAKWVPIRANGRVQIHALNHRGKGTRLAVIADDFAGWERLKGRKGDGKPLPDPVLVDLTAERNRDLVPDPYPSGAAGIGYGTRCASDLLRANPGLTLTLIRIDPSAPYMLQTVARAINGESVTTICMEQRLEELRQDRIHLDRERDYLIAERKRVFGLGLEEEEAQKQRDAYLKRQAEYDRDEKAYRDRTQRYFQLLRDLKALDGIRVVATTILWKDGHPALTDTSLSRYFDERPFRAALWFEAAGDDSYQTWRGLFRDSDGNGVMEFADPKKRLPVGSWSSELNFMGWQPPTGLPVREVPAGTRLRLTLQWREVHDPLPLRQGEDVYREPLAKLNLLVVYQPDPQGKTRPAEDLEVVAQSAGSPVRLNQTRNTATYEHVVEMVATRGGRYAVFIEGKAPSGITAPGENTLPGQVKYSELHPRLFAQTLSGNGRAVWVDFVTTRP